MNLFKVIISDLIKTSNYTEITNGLLSLILEDKMNSTARNDYLSKYGYKINDLKNESLSVVIDFSIVCLKDNYLSEEEVHNIRLLKLFLNIKEGDFIKHGRKKEIEEIITLQLEKMYQDNYISENEAILKTDLQELYGLSYDQFLDIVNIVARKSLKSGGHPLNLDTFMKCTKSLDN